MLFFYGISTYKSKKSPVKIYRSCSDCQAYNSLSVIPIFKYAHIFWIPLFYAGKDYILHCDSCGLYYQGGVKVGKDISRNIKPPIWTFSGLIAIVLLIAFLLWTNITNQEKSRKQTLEYIETPQSGDIYEVKVKDDEFTLLKVDRVIGDSVYFLVHDFAVTRSYEIQTLNKEEYADKYTVSDGYTRKELKEFLKEGFIQKINR